MSYDDYAESSSSSVITATYWATTSILPTDPVSSRTTISCTGSLGCHGKYLEGNTRFLIRAQCFHHLLPLHFQEANYPPSVRFQ